MKNKENFGNKLRPMEKEAELREPIMMNKELNTKRKFLMNLTISLILGLILNMILQEMILKVLTTKQKLNLNS
jgi:hypothetical protein